MPCAIMRFEKRKGGPASAIEKHHERKKERYASNPDVDTDRSHLNYHLIQPQHKYYAEIQSRIERAQRENPKCKVRKDSVKFIDTIVTVVGIVGLSERLAKFSEAVQDRAEKAGDSWQWGKEEFREKMHDLSESSQERVANMRQLVSSALNWQQRRMIRSFPRMRSTDSTKYSKIMETVREMLRRK